MVCDQSPGSRAACKPGLVPVDSTRGVVDLGTWAVTPRGRFRGVASPGGELPLQLFLEVVAPACKHTPVQLPWTH